MAQIISNTQINFFKRIKDQLPAQYSLVDEIAGLLNVSNDSAYRRMRGETALSMDELSILCKRFNVSLNDAEAESAEAIVFAYKAIDNTDITLEKYLSAIDEDMSKISLFQQKEILYAAKDIPLFHHFHFPELAAFKIFFWMKSILNCPSHEKLVFDAANIQQQDVALGKKILKTYIDVPSAEIWTEETLNSTVKQLEYYWESGFMKDRQTALLVCDQLLGMMEHVKDQAERGCKYFYGERPFNEEGSFKLYFSEVMIGNNNILVKTGSVQTTYVTHNTLNYLITNNQSFCNETDFWLKNLIKRSVLLSGASEKQRNQFFRKAFDSIKQVRNKIEQG